MLIFKFSLYAIKARKLKILVFVTLCISFRSFGQLEVVSIYHDVDSHNKQQANARTATLTPMALPFWDDFSFNNSLYWPSDTLWENSKSVWVNSGTGINPPTINVATFDGYDSLGRPYILTDVLAKGVADIMTSRTLLLGDVQQANRSSVFLSFFYQYSGNGDAPEPGDIFSLYFKNNIGQWEQVWSIDNSKPLSKTEFKEIIIPITDPKFFHNNFQFRFQSFGRLSGPYDVWNLDYVYLSSGKNQYAPIYQDHPDRAVSTTLTSLFKDYWAMPLTHFFSSPYPTNEVAPVVVLNNLRKDQTPTQGGQPVRFNSLVTIYSKSVGASTTSPLNNNRPVIGNLYYNDPKNIALDNDPLPDLTSYSTEKDSLNIKLDFSLTSSDNIKKISTTVGDFDTVAYKGINFKLNDITSSQNILATHYAYDDGVAEYGAKIVGKGTQLAYQFDMKATNSDIIIAVDIYFPRFGDDSNQTIQLFIAKALTGNISDYLYQQDLIVQRHNRNDKYKFWRIEIPAGVIVKDKFYVGWKLNSDAFIPVGLDASNDSGSKIFYKTLNSDSWVQNTNIKGSLMIRPRFGKPQNVTTSILDDKEISLYPNPTKGIFYLPADAEQIQLVDLAGKEVQFDLFNQIDSKQITISNPITGLFLVRYFTNKWITQKVMVLP